MEKFRWKITVNSEIGPEVFKRYGSTDEEVRTAFEKEYFDMFGVNCTVMDVHKENWQEENKG